VVLNSEQKKSNSVETSLASVDRATTSNLDMLESDSNAAVRVSIDRPVETNLLWLFDVQGRASMTTKVFLATIVFTTIAGMYFVISAGLSSSDTIQVKTYYCHETFTNFHVTKTRPRPF